MERFSVNWSSGLRASCLQWELMVLYYSKLKNVCVLDYSFRCNNSEGMHTFRQTLVTLSANGPNTCKCI